MSTYAVGDLQGCIAPLERLLETVRFDPAEDRLWLVGDLVNRGPNSSSCLRLARSLGDSAVVVLGNHDLHLLATASGSRPPRPKDTLKEVLRQPDAGELLDWLASRPLIHHDPILGWTLVHAGIPPQWTLADACAEAGRVEAILRTPSLRAGFLQEMYGNDPDRWNNGNLEGIGRLRYTVNALTRMRFIRPDGGLDLVESGPPGSGPAGFTPWYQIPGRATAGHPIAFGHWSALGFLRGPDWISLDSGCVWGRSLTLVRLDSRSPENSPFWQQDCQRNR